MEPTKPFISIILPCYNEEAILKNTLDIIINYLNFKSAKYAWEILIINDGSKDQTGHIADIYSDTIKNIRVFHHPINLNHRTNVRQTI